MFLSRGISETCRRLHDIRLLTVAADTLVWIVRCYDVDLLAAVQAVYLVFCGHGCMATRITVEHTVTTRTNRP